MIQSEQFNYSDFTRNNYRCLLQKAKENYIFRGYRNYRDDEHFLLWRHDVDFSVHAARKLAYIEAEEGVSSTYFLMLHSDFYNLLEKNVSNYVRDILSFGHTIGLHFDSDFYEIADTDTLEKRLKLEADFLSETFGVPIDAFSFHNPSAWALEQQEHIYAGMVNTYAAYFQSNVGYCSDSNGYWRYRRLIDVLEKAQDQRLQVVTHPAWWVDVPCSPRDRIVRCVEGRAAYTIKKYDADLEKYGRSNVGIS